MKRAGVLYLLLWLLLSAFAGLTAWYLNLAILYLFTLWIEHPVWRPTYWTVNMLVYINKLSILGLGGLWLIFITWLEIALRNSALQDRLWLQAGKIGLIIGAVLAFSFVIFMVG
ncbi:MAG: hypothetical protein R2911_16440 [Caldilineaceae bacterium]